MTSEQKWVETIEPQLVFDLLDMFEPAEFIMTQLCNAQYEGWVLDRTALIREFLYMLQEWTLEHIEQSNISIRYTKRLTAYIEWALNELSKK